MLQDYRLLTDAQLDALEKQTLRMIVQAVQEYSREAREIFENTTAPSETELIVLAEDLTQYALEVAETYPINRRFAGFIDYKRVRWMPTPFGLFPQVLLIDAKAYKENNRTTLQQSQLSMVADFKLTRGARKGQAVRLNPWVPPHLELPSQSGAGLPAVTTSGFMHFHYSDLESKTPPYRKLHGIYVLLLPHQRLKPVYNPDANKSFFGEGKQSPKRKEDPRIRVYFRPMLDICPWRLQELKFDDGSGYSTPLWRDVQQTPAGQITTVLPFDFIGR